MSENGCDIEKLLLIMEGQASECLYPNLQAALFGQRNGGFDSRPIHPFNYVQREFLCKTFLSHTQNLIALR